MSPADSEDQRVGVQCFHRTSTIFRSGPCGPGRWQRSVAWPRDQLQASHATRRLANARLSNGGLSVFLCGRLMSGAGWPVSTLSYLEL